MSDENVTDITPLLPDEPPPGKPRVKKLRLLALLLPLVLLAVVSTVFGMMMAVASDLPDLENQREFQDARNSILYDVRGQELGVLTNNQSRVLVDYDDISPYMRSAIIAIEDQRFFSNPGVDVRGIARAFVQDVLQKKAAQGGSTITQQFVKNALQAQDKRTLFQKLREAALAYHLTRKWSKEKILTQYLNSIYFGNGAYGVESAARTYFGNEADHLGCGTRGHTACAKQLKPEEAALLAGMVANPSGYDPVAHPVTARRRRDLVLDKMFQQGLLDRVAYVNAKPEPLPGRIEPPRVLTGAPYFTTWVRQVLVDHFGARKAFEGGLKITTTLDLDLQNAAQNAVTKYLPNVDGPTAAVVAIDNDTGEVRAMVGGRDYAVKPFNLATQGQRQPGSAIKPFILAAALRKGISPQSVWTSAPKVFTVPGTNGQEKFPVKNFEDTYTGRQTLAGALTYSDNSVFAEVGISGLKPNGPKKIAMLAERMGIRTPISTNYAMTLGGLEQGVTPLDMAHAYETLIAGGQRISGTLGAGHAGPVGIRRVETLKDGQLVEENKPRRTRVLSTSVANEAVQIMSTVVSQGTGRRAALDDGTFAAGKTGTTENSGDAWFVGFTDRLTVAVWVGYPDELRPMLTEFYGDPVEGGTFPALIWHDFMQTADQIFATRRAHERELHGLPPEEGTVTGATTGATTVPETATGATTTPAEGTATGATTTPGSSPTEEDPGAGQTTVPEPTEPVPPDTPEGDTGTDAGGSGGASAPP